MANVDSNSNDRRLADPSKIYEENATTIYEIASAFQSDAAAASTLEGIAADLLSELPASGYSKYARLVAFRALHRRVLANPKARPPRDLANAGLTIQETFCLILRDRFEVSCPEIAAIVEASEGSIRTRLERARARVYRGEGDRQQNLSRAGETGPNHLCIKILEQIEDWNIATSRLGQFTTPFAVTRAIENCPRCTLALQRRLSSLGHFREMRLSHAPEKLRTFPISPVLVREGRRVLVNWSSAPWYAKALFEGLLATTLVLGIVLSIPRIKSAYEFWLERRLDLYSVAELAAGLGTTRTDTNSESAGAQKKSAKPGGAVSSADGSASSAALAEAGTESSPESSGQVAVRSETEFGTREASIPSSDKIYRVLIKTDSPEAVRDQVMKLLSNAHFSAGDSDSPPGSELPGGVIFDVFVPFKSYKTLVSGLERIGETRFIILRSKEHNVPGKAHLKIWLQRI